MLKLLLAMIAVLMASAVACGDDDDDDATTAPTVATSAATSATPGVSPTASTSAPTKLSSTQMAPAVSVTADDSWSSDYESALEIVFKHKGDAETPTGYIDIFAPAGAYADDGITVEALPGDLAEWVRGYDRLVKQSETAVTLGGLSGVQFVLAAEGDADFKVFKLSGDDVFEMRYNDRVRLTVLEGASRPIVIAEVAETATRLPALEPVSGPVIATIEFSE